MSTRPGVEEVDGVLMTTARGVKPPVGWTSDYEQLGGDAEWKEGGQMQQLLEEAGIDVTGLKPLYTMEAWTGGDMVLFETGSPAVLYFFSPIDYSLRKINLITDLKELVEWIDDEDKGYASLDFEQIF